MFAPLDRILNGITMYRVALYLLAGLAAVAIILSAAGLLTFSSVSLIGSLLILFAVTYGVNWLIARLMGVPSNPESPPITALILFFVLAPATDLRVALLIALAGAVAMASKYLFAINRQHIFNPAAIAAVIVGIPTGIAAWWIGTPVMLPFTLIAALLMVRKVRRFELFFAVLIPGALMAVVLGIMHGQSIPTALWQFIASWPVIFFAAFMVTEPFTSPGTRRARLLYGIAIGVVSNWPFHIGSLYSTPELTLVLANLAAFATGMRRRLVLRLTHREEIALDTYHFRFATDRKPSFRAGQYLEWTLPHNGDERGIRRYFTIASSPTEDELAIGVKFFKDGSSFKNRLLALEPGDTMYASIRGGDFTLPTNKDEKLTFIAGGIGVTPFRSMVKELVDRKEQRDAVLFYAAKTAPEVAYRPLWQEAAGIGLRTVFVYAADETTGDDVEHGFITADMLTARLPNWKERTFYLSGPDAMVRSYKKLLRDAGVTPARIHTDYFPGF